MTEIYVAYILQILSFFSPFRLFEMNRPDIRLDVVYHWLLERSKRQIVIKFLINLAFYVISHVQISGCTVYQKRNTIEFDFSLWFKLSNLHKDLKSNEKYKINHIIVFIKVGLSPFTKVVFICFHKSDDEKSYLFYVKSSICSWKIRVFSNISRSKQNQTMKFGQLIEYKMRNTFLEKLYKNVPEKLSPDLSIKN